ncbi:death-on-curing protein [Dolosigranulum pigrum]|jgi:death-on-curing family protein|uniref:Death-on-curing protein n=1 Tax=Dolosigranulum pigrum TaxID=29394 RepID=A0A328KRV2_9LACT|nr:type II toxin-antitoxin system death-on-curing family toxin [Dolosigranulum pigrum]QDO91981.1 type II toxin-antitoxin system death-on-curing family toxin [Dolosigranulum pigrum]QJS95921.1 type II toxin-antitoxin system death-on-curing family toxin [Dolosigranulum pigrum]QTJ40350.1 type II toxin-antitoxin system death-on-curing family toxin [Dolosigranulum pigrum]QTJ44933.1 type II toxin-antitoxin system death-on-curing family toxin [Dolosigranulum pigrum]QTJ48834.1 type II toxin-antitoxin s
MNKITYFDLADVIKYHDFIIEQTTGLPGIKDKGQLESVLYHIQNDNYYPTFEDKLTHLVYAIVEFHMFYDGNKRTSIIMGAYFLDINGLDGLTGTFIEEMENIVLWVAQGRIDKNFLLDIISSILEHEKLSDEIKLRLAMI